MTGIVAELRKTQKRARKNFPNGLSLIPVREDHLAALLDIVEAMANCDPVEHLELANVCLFCEADDLRQYPLTHAPNCPYIRAREMCGKGDD